MPSAASVVKVAPAAPKVEETPIAPSLEFMRWLSESLKGLNNSVNRMSAFVYFIGAVV